MRRIRVQVQRMGKHATHQPVLYKEIIHLLQPRRAGRYIDGTLGAGGHAWGILEASEPDGLLLGLDVDAVAIELAKTRLAPFMDRVTIIQSSYDTLSTQLDAIGWPKVDGILLDLGLSSMQLADPERGFSFLHDAPLDMRFDQRGSVRADDLVNTLPEKDLADLLYEYGEEKRSRKVARAIVRARPVNTTRQLAEIISANTTSGRPGMHPATRTFQALRIAVNRELDSLEDSLPQALDALSPGGRLAVIAYHSLEDRIVKHFFRNESVDCLCPPKQPVCTCGHVASVEIITKHPVRPDEVEIKENPRARSARLRVAERISTK
jgi:16S rRNA (cytosine1402-N4)-methyltransferase